LGVKVKICGITNLEDAKASIDAGCDALGYVFYKKSPRYITPLKAKDIIGQLPRNIIKIGVFVNSSQKSIKHIAKLCSLDMLQFHGNESVEFCRKFKDYRIIKAFLIKDSINLKNILKYNSFAYLFDTFVKSKAGGTGKSFDWKLIRRIAGLKRPVFLSGGLTARNVKSAIKSVHPAWVDVSSSVELRPGKKDHNKVEKFIKIAKSSL
jgi:phosphoribosylanthranilate isomerase